MKLRIGVLAVLGVLPLVLAGCGGGGNKAGASSSNTSGTSGASGDTSAFTQCLSDHGVTLPSGGNFGGGPPGGGEGGVPSGSFPNPGEGGGPPGGTFPGGNNSKFQEAIQACRSKLPNGGQGNGFPEHAGVPGVHVVPEGPRRRGAERREWREWFRRARAR